MTLLLVEELEELRERLWRAEALAEVRKQRIKDPNDPFLRRREATIEENCGTLAQRIASIADRALEALTPAERDAELARRERERQARAHG